MKTVETISKRLLVSGGIFGTGAILSLLGLGLGFWLNWATPEFIIAFLVALVIFCLISFAMFILEWITKRETKKGKRDSEHKLLDLVGEGKITMKDYYLQKKEIWGDKKNEKRKKD